MKNYRFLSLLIVMIFASWTLSAQKLSMGFIYPAGGAQGSSVDIEIGGMNIKEATSAIVSGDGVRTEIIALPVPKEEYFIDKNGKKRKKFKGLGDQSAPQLADRIGVRVHIAKNATPGLRSLRLQSLKGVSNQLSFEVSHYPNVLESKKRGDVEPVKVGSLPATLCGYVKPGEIDRFKFRATKGTMLVAEVKGRIFVPYIADAVPGWFQPVVKIVNSKGEEIAYGDDYKTSPDPVIRVMIDKTDTYTISIHDAIYRGREDFNYRIQLGEIPFVESIYPLVARVSERSSVEVKGVNISTKNINIKPSKEGLNYITIKNKDGHISNRLPYWAAAANEKIITKPTPKTKIDKGVLLYDHIEKPYQQKIYSVDLAVGENVILDALARRIDSRADLKLTLLTPDGKMAMESDDVEDTYQGLMTHHADPVLHYTAKQSGTYSILVEDIQGHSGKDYSYIIRRQQPSAPFEAFVNPANITIPQGGTASFLMSFDFKTKKRTSGISHIELANLPEGFKVSNIVPGLYPRMWEVSVSAPKDAKVGTFPVDVRVHTAPFKGEKAMVASARATDNMMQAFYYTHYIPAESFTVEVVPAIPYSVHYAPDVEADLYKPITINPTDSLIPLKICVDRSEGFHEELELALGKKGREFSFVPEKMGANESEKTIYIKINRQLVAKQKYFRRLLYITASVNGEIHQQGMRKFQNALYKDMTPVIVVQKEGMPILNHANLKKQLWWLQQGGAGKGGKAKRVK